ncbi:MAG: hypothetical protein COT91_00050 [Candidatus Doudnabacteria bacterium CG10_big_fil_rev_8_21_14_0_10_41_10]|uniref:EF-hand domain-containing protein n=1 Tax=Candidatus Doudnabacteria bacterium CG10_big_fil_rev_8_21_14_0_10_41_10 TaxID=1974551 RepID=A0A2H0VF38_9BACT|nr:MAG: hypothetical protein COT91_00050 [Candidatus Doudnabacteria bacterium CG10_big_fil_rev_8_21_14_0_10_41_10]
MGLFSSEKKISKQKLDELLRKIAILELSEREYIKGLFSRYSSGDISKLEIEKVVRDLKLDTSDKIEREEAETVKQQLLDYLEK